MWENKTEERSGMARFLLSQFGTSFATRGQGEELRKQAMECAGDVSTLIVDFAGVERVSYSFADEFAGKLVAADDDLVVEVTQASKTVARTVEGAVRRRMAPPAC